jgi:hypothetical protein
MTRRGAVGGVLIAAVAVGALWLGGPSAVAAETRATKSQASAAVTVYKEAREQCTPEGPACEERAKRQFVEVMNCVVRGQLGVDPATLDREFTSYVEMLSAVLDAQETARPTDVGPCFAAPAGAREEAAGGQGPTAESLRRFRKQSEEQSRPVPPAGDRGTASAHERLKAEVEAMRATGRGGPSGVPVPVVPK